MKRTLLLILLLLALPLYADEPKTVKFTLSPETTYLMVPQLPDGRINYLAVLNEQLSAQTTPENNLLVGIFSLVLGEREEALLQDHEAQTDEQKAGMENIRKYREQFWKMLGLDAPPPLDSLAAVSPLAYAPSLSTKNYEQGLREFYSAEELAPMIEQQREKERERVKSRLDAGRITQEEYDAEIKTIETETSDRYYREIVLDQWHQSLRRPWTAEEFPYLARWIATTDDWTPKLLDIVRQRTGYYHPLISGSNMFHDVLLPYVQSLRMAARHFQCRGSFEFARGNVDEAMECAFATIRMGRTMRKGSPTIVEDLVGIAMCGMGTHQLTTQLAILPKDKDAAWIMQKKKEFDAIETEIGPLPWLPLWCLAERWGGLTLIQQVAIEPKTAEEFYFKLVFEGQDEEFIAKVKNLYFSGKEYDWDEILRRANFFYDDLEDVYLLPNWQRRDKAAERFEQRLQEYQQIGDASPEQLAAAHLLGNYIIPSVKPVVLALARAEWINRITSVAFALAAYRADNDGNSPDTLEQLVPKYLDSVPDSPFTDKPLRYIKRQHDVLIANDDKFKLDGSEEEVEKMIAEQKSGSYAYPSAQHFVFVVTKSE